MADTVLSAGGGEGALAVARQQPAGAPQPPQLLLSPLRVAVEAAFWTRRYGAVRFVASVLPPQVLEAQLYAPLRAERGAEGGAVASRSAFLKTLCKEANLSLRALRAPGGAAADGGAGGAGGRGGEGPPSVAPGRAAAAPAPKAAAAPAAAPADGAPLLAAAAAEEEAGEPPATKKRGGAASK